MRARRGVSRPVQPFPPIMVSALVTAMLALAPLPAGAESLEDALAAAYTNNPALQAERATLRATDENLPQALSNWRPTVQLTASGGVDHTSSKQNSNAEIFGGSTSSNLGQQSYGLTVTQPLYRGGRTEAQTEEALSLIRAERAHLVVTEQTVLLNAVTDYMNVVRDQAVLELNINNEQVLRRQLEAAQDRFHVGEVTRTDVAQAEAALASAIASRQAAAGTLQIDRAGYQRDIGDLPDKLLAPKAMPQLPASRDEATTQALTANPNVVDAEFTRQAAEDDVRVVRGQLLPQVSLVGQVQRAKNQVTPGLQTDVTSLVAQVQMPLYEAGSIYSQSRQAQETVSERQHQLDDTRRAAVQSAATAWEQLASAHATVLSVSSQIHANEIALDGVQQEAAVGSRTVLDILNAEQVLFQSRVTLVQDQHDEVVAQFTLASSVGRLTAKNLGLAVQFYDPDVNFNQVRNKWFGFGTGP